MTLKSLLSFAGGLAFAAQTIAATPFGAFQIEGDGSLKSADFDIAAIQFGAAYKRAVTQKPSRVKAAPGYPKDENGAWTLKGVFDTPSGAFDMLETVKKSGDDTYTLSMTLSSVKPIPCAELALLLSLPVEKFAGRAFSIDGKSGSFPAAFKDRALTSGSFKSFSTQCQDFKLSLSGGNGILVQDDRAFGNSTYAVRVGFSPRCGELTNARIDVSIKAVAYVTKPLDLSKVFNFGFKDEFAGDGKGGWTDQGPENDLRALKPGATSLGGVKFEIVDPVKNGGKSCLVFGGVQIPALPKRAAVELPPVKAKFLCVLNALGWPPGGKTKIGSVNVNYADGSSQSIPVVKGVDTDNWWCPLPLANGAVAWTGENASSYVGLYLSTFPLEDKPLKGVEFVSDGNSMWMIVAASVSDDAIPTRANIPYFSVANADWKPFELPRRVEKGSALDFSDLGLLDAPAGKHGRVIAKDGHFSFENSPAKTQRFYGTNIYFGICFPEKAQAEKLADMVASCGYNSVRFHHFDAYLAAKGDPSQTSLDKEKMDKFHYFFKCLKDKGIYITIDLYTIRAFPHAGRKLDIQEAKIAMLLDDAARDNLLRFAQNLLTDVNPYTALAWKDDTALAFVSCINEDPMLWLKNFERMPEAGKKLFADAFAAWLKVKGLGEPSAAERRTLETKFIVEAQDKAFAKMSAFLRGLGVKAPLTDQNNMCTATMALMRDKYDYVDNHAYWAHPSFVEKAWQLPMRADGNSVIKKMASVPAYLFPTRLFGKPFTVTEFNYCFPNQFRAEGGAVMGAYAALQDWDAVYRFGYIGDAKNQLEGERPTGLFDGVDDPMQLMSDRLGVLLFLRGDVKPSALKIPVAVRPDLVEACGGERDYPRVAANAGLVGQVGSVVGDDPKAPLRADAPESGDDAVAKLKQTCDFGKGELDVLAKFARSSTGEIEIDGANGTFKVVTPRTEAFVALKEGKLSGDAVAVDNKQGFASVSVSSLDGKPLAESKRLLVLHLTNTLNTMTKFRDSSMTVLENYGKLPRLARRGVAEIGVKMTPGAAPKVYGVDLGGKRLGEVEAKFSTDGTLSFTVDTFTFPRPCFVYEIVR